MDEVDSSGVGCRDEELDLGKIEIGVNEDEAIVSDSRDDSRLVIEAAK